MYNDQIIGVFIDIASLHKNVKRLYQGKLDYRKYLDRVEKEGIIHRAYAYGTQVDDEASKFVSYLKYIGFQTKYTKARKKPLRPENIYNDMEKVFKLERNDNIFRYLEAKINEDVYYVIQHYDRTIDIIIDVIRQASKLDTIVIGTSNMNILPLIKLLKERRIKVIVFSCNIPQPLKLAADVWWEITDKYLEERIEDEKKSLEESIG